MVTVTKTIAQSMMDGYSIKVMSKYIQQAIGVHQQQLDLPGGEERSLILA